MSAPPLDREAARAARAAAREQHITEMLARREEQTARRVDKRGDRRSGRIRERLADANFSSAIYGEILLLSILVVLVQHEVHAGTVLATVVSSQLVFWLAHAYSESIGEQIKTGDTFGFRDVGRIMEHEWPIAQAAGPTVVLMLLALAGVFSAETGVYVAFGIGVVQLFGWGFAAGRRNGAPRGAQFVMGILSGGLGLVIVALKFLIH